jgi:hypothetical protein
MRSGTGILPVGFGGIGILPMIHGLEGDPQRIIPRWGPQAHATLVHRPQAIALPPALWGLPLVDKPVVVIIVVVQFPLNQHTPSHPPPSPVVSRSALQPESEMSCVGSFQTGIIPLWKRTYGFSTLARTMTVARNAGRSE